MNAISCVLGCGVNPVCDAGCMDQLTQCMLGCVLSKAGVSGTCSLALNNMNAEAKKIQDIQQLQKLLQQAPNQITAACATHQ